MGITGLWDVVRKRASARQVDLAVLSAECIKENGRPLRLAVDVSNDVYKYSNGTQAARTAGGMNHPTRTFFFHVLHYMMVGVQPIFIFDGPEKPPMKRDRYVPRQPPSNIPVPVAVASSLRNAGDIEKEFTYGHLVRLYRQVLDVLGVPWLEAPGEAEAECAALEKAGIVDAICTKDGDALAFGGVHVLLPCNKDVRKGRTILPVQTFEAKSPSSGTEVLPKDDLVLLALMAGGDYDHGIPQCGPDLAMAAAEAGYGKDLINLANSGAYVPSKLVAWRNKLRTEVQNGRFGNRHRHVADHIPTEFPEMKILNLYIRPKVSSEEELQQLKQTICWHRQIDIQKLQDFTKLHFDWKGRNFAKKFINALCSPLLARALLHHSEIGEDATGLFTGIKKRREAVSNESPDELRLEFIPEDIVHINWQAEPIMIGYNTQFDEKNRYDPSDSFCDWFPAFLIESGAPIQYASWTESLAVKNGQNKKPRPERDPSPPPERLTSPKKKASGRPRKVLDGQTAETEGSAQPGSGRKRGRPAKKSALDVIDVGQQTGSRTEYNMGAAASSSINSTPRKRLKVLAPISFRANDGVEHEQKSVDVQAQPASTFPTNKRSLDPMLPPFSEDRIDDDVVILSSRVVSKDSHVDPSHPTSQKDKSDGSLSGPTTVSGESQEKSNTTSSKLSVIKSKPKSSRERMLNNSAFIK
ncbi:Flap structure-specific endonuclease [Lasiodiplodia theobromae]|uniref:Flap structure-specific endonuclease n=1 Tax=Lasiodiplodia theobromae TaxID=45133 RepID=UPI0015C2D9CF|nr:Flap structure-specific endonuclease [Lasiodiplodia theobromae]KAF4542567.1 Flap structure-specific endonuclease [Lasiodiplodia theobromae]